MTRAAAHLREIRALCQGRVLEQPLLCKYSSFRIGGPADVIAEPRTRNGLIQLVQFLKAEAIPYVVIGRGTNVLFHDAGFRGVVVRTRGLGYWGLSPNGSQFGLFTVEAGVSLPFLVTQACKRGFGGLEDLWGIPGSLGGAVKTNAGAGRTSVGEHLRDVTILTSDGQVQHIEQEELCFGYRFVNLPAGSLVLEARMRLTRESPEIIHTRLRAAKFRRRSSQPRGIPSAGCVFKNPASDLSAGAMIDRLGLKGLRVGDAQVSEIHGNFIVNRGQARARDVLELIEIIRSRVEEQEHVSLSLEIQVIGEEGAR